MKIRVIGSGGMLGHITTLYLAERGYEVYDISKTKKCRKETTLLDVCTINVFLDYLQQHHFDVVINCAALLVHASEDNPEMAEILNAKFPHWFESYYKETSTRIFQVSTAGVFRGDNAPYSETDICDASGCYNETKMRGELNNEKDLTIRSDFWGPNINGATHGLFHWVMAAQGEVAGYSNVVINGVSSLEFAHFVELAIQIPLRGIYHLHSEECISKANFIRGICEVFEKTDISIRDVTEPRKNTCLEIGNKYIQYHTKDYAQQMKDVREWINNHRDLYLGYF